MDKLVLYLINGSPGNILYLIKRKGCTGFRPSRCGGCRAMWYVNDQEVNCYEQYGVDVRK